MLRVGFMPLMDTTRETNEHIQSDAVSLGERGCLGYEDHGLQRSAAAPADAEYCSAAGIIIAW